MWSNGSFETIHCPSGKSRNYAFQIMMMMPVTYITAGECDRDIELVGKHCNTQALLKTKPFFRLITTIPIAAYILAISAASGAVMAAPTSHTNSFCLPVIDSGYVSLHETYIVMTAEIMAANPLPAGTTPSPLAQHRDRHLKISERSLRMRTIG